MANKITKHKFDFGRKSLKNLICACIYFAAIISYVTVLAIYKDNLITVIGHEQAAPDVIINIPVLSGLGVCTIVSFVLGIMLLVFDINLARYARSSKTFSNQMISLLTFALIPAICIAMFVVEYYMVVAQAVFNILPGIEEAKSSDDPAGVLERVFKDAFTAINYFAMISNAVIAGMVVWQITLNSLNVHVNRR